MTLNDFNELYFGDHKLAVIDATLMDAFYEAISVDRFRNVIREIEPDVIIDSTSYKLSGIFRKEFAQAEVKGFTIEDGHIVVFAERDHTK